MKASRSAVIRPLATPMKSEPVLRLLPTPEAAFEQPTLDLAFVRPATQTTLQVVTGGPAPARRRPVETFGVQGAAVDDGLFAHQPTSSTELPSPNIWSRTFAQALAEVLYGKRPPHQIVRWVTPKFGAYLRSPLLKGDIAKIARESDVRGSDRVRVARIRVDQPADGVAHVAAVIESRRRSRALAYRLEGWDGRWLCTSANLL